MTRVFTWHHASRRRAEIGRERMDDFDPAGAIRKALSEAEYRLFTALLAAPSAALSAARAHATEELGHALATLTQRADALVGLLSRVPHNIAESILTQFLIPGNTRVLTHGEKAQAREAFGARATPLARKALVSYGGGTNPVALLAFANGNPAITLGNAMYFRPAFWKSNFAAPNGNLPIFLHEFTHVIQWDRMGYGVFLRRYLLEKKTARSAERMYDYRRRHTDFSHEMLEGQAQMVEDYTRLRRRIPPGQEAQAADLKRRLSGSGIYGL